MITCQMIISRDQGKAFALEHPAFRIAAEKGDEYPVPSAEPAQGRRRPELSTQLAILLQVSLGSAILPWRFLASR
jgi:hypothetical protein